MNENYLIEPMGNFPEVFYDNTENHFKCVDLNLALWGLNALVFKVKFTH